MRKLHVLSVASEVFPLVKTGGLADVVGALPAALARERVAVRTLVPGYPGVTDALRDASPVYAFAQLHGGAARLLAGSAAGLDLFVLDAPHLYARPGNPYSSPDGSEWPDNALRFAALSTAAAAIGRGIVGGYVPDVVHAHDWQAGLAVALLHYGGEPRPRTVMTVHNLAFQGQFSPHLLGAIGLPPQAFGIDGVEYYGSISYLKAGLALADHITTVSQSYASEIRTPDGGMGFDGLLRSRAGVLTGIRNGIDENVWNPANDPHLASRFDARHRGRRAPNKAALQARLGLAIDGEMPLFGVISRLTWQKGMDLVASALPGLLGGGAQFALLGNGDAALEDRFLGAARNHAGRVAAVIGYDEGLAHLMQAGIDALLVPSRFEPCGLTQLCALHYGAIPLVSRVGGLADTVIDANEMAVAAGVATGVQFSPVTPERLVLANAHALRLWRTPRVWHRLQARAMATDVGWSAPAKQYARIFRELVSTSLAP
jgi:starch synthase